MDDNTTKIIKEKFNSLPTKIQETILSSDYENTLINIAKQYQLNVEQSGILERETTLVMMGLTPTESFTTELTRELGVDRMKGEQIAKNINEKIFLKIRELLKLMNAEDSEQSPIGEANEKGILSSAGIEIVPEKLELSSSEKPMENREDLLKKIENPEPVHPILTQKLSSAIQTPTVQTDHSLNNLTSSNASSVVNKTTPTPYPPKKDPYREIPE